VVLVVVAVAQRAVQEQRIKVTLAAGTQGVRTSLLAVAVERQ
jgi:hypothetical protein